MANAFQGTVSESQKMGACTTVSVQGSSSGPSPSPPSPSPPSPSPGSGMQLPFGLNLIDVVVAGGAVGAAIIALFATGVF